LSAVNPVADISLLDHQVERELPMDGHQVGEQALIPGAFQPKELVANALLQTEPYIDHPTEQKPLGKPLREMLHQS
jgi:hypothetical protein